MTNISRAPAPHFTLSEVLADDGKHATVIAHRVGEPRESYVAQVTGDELLHLCPAEDVRCRDCRTIILGCTFSGRCLYCHEAAMMPVEYEPDQEDDSLAWERSHERAGLRFLD